MTPTAVVWESVTQERAVWPPLQGSGGAGWGALGGFTAVRTGMAVPWGWGQSQIGMRGSTRRIEAGRCADRKATWPVAIHVGNPIPRTVRPFERVAQNATQAIHRF